MPQLIHFSRDQSGDLHQYMRSFDEVFADVHA